MYSWQLHLPCGGELAKGKRAVMEHGEGQRKLSAHSTDLFPPRMEEDMAWLPPGTGRSNVMGYKEKPSAAHKLR